MDEVAGRARRRRRVWLAPVAVLVAVMVGACESTVVGRVDDQRVAAAVARLTTSDYLTTQARAHSAAMCAAGAVAPSTDLVASYLGEPATRLRELVASAALDPSIPDPSARNGAATDDIWGQWAG